MGVKVVCRNKKARFDYFVLDKFEAGMSLLGSEVKSLRDGGANLKDSYVTIEKNELILQNAHISPYKSSSYNNHEPERRRKLLMHKKEILRLKSKLQEKGLGLVPLAIYFKQGKAKAELGLVKGKKKYDKREAIKAKAAGEKIRKTMVKKIQ